MARRLNLHKQAGYIDADFLLRLYTFPLQSDGGPYKVLILGATGLVGRNALAQALARPAITQVIAPTRKPLKKHDKLTNRVATELELRLPKVACWEPNAAICATGTTINKAGSKEAFRFVDHDLPLSFARLAHQAGTQNFALVSAIGASVDSSFYYAKVKGELERDVREVASGRSPSCGPASSKESATRSVSPRASC